jgi:holliday junction DNA helicase RuvA
MIALLRGTIVQREPNRAVVDVQGVGYEVFAPNRAIEAWGTGDCLVHVSTQVREDAITLYGFASPLDRQAFQVLMSVSGIGPKLALACLDGLALGDLAAAIEKDDITTLSRIPGVGKKTAQRLALELKGKLPAGFVTPTSGTAPVAGKPVVDDTFALALEKLGYTATEIAAVKRKLTERGIADDAPIGERIRQALGLLYRGER